MISYFYSACLYIQKTINPYVSFVYKNQKKCSELPYKFQLGFNVPETNFSEAFEKLSLGSSRAERLCGLEPGTVMTRISIVGYQPFQGVAGYGKPHSMFIFHSLATSQQEISLWSFHETIHALDDCNNMVLSSGEFALLFTEIKENYPQFFEELSEHNFLPSLVEFKKK